MKIITVAIAAFGYIYQKRKEEIMKKRAIALLLAVMTAGTLMAGCGSKDNKDAQSTESSTMSTEEGAEGTEEAGTESTKKTYGADGYLSGIKAEDYVTLCDIKSIPVEMEDPRKTVTDEYVESQINSNLANSAELVEVTDRDTAENGDTVNIDYVGKKDGVAFDGGTANGYDLELGSGTFIPGFEDGVVGMKKGETKTLELTFPENYGNADLAGAAVTFDVTLNKIQESVTPELTDEWVKNQSISGVENVEQYKSYEKTQILKDAQNAYDQQVQNSAAQYVFDNSTFKQEPPAEMANRMYDALYESYSNWAANYGVDMEEFMGAIGYDSDKWEEELNEDSVTKAKQYIIMQAVADEAGLTISDSEYKTALSTQAASNGYTSSDDFEEAIGKEELMEYLTGTKVLEYLGSVAVVTEPAESADDTAAEASTEEAAQ